ncbi:MAG: DNA topoisomerase VI subunit B, partial [Phycisphaerae bacterium]|nr:DNA topoisomerase VI subunit B [Phycisphaerae bacterium]
MTATGTRRKTKTPARRGKSKGASPKRAKSTKSAGRSAGRDAETLAGGQREISVSEFFAKNRHLLGFDNPRKALLTTVKEAVDNALDACEEGGILPELFIGIEALSETRYVVTVRDNGPGIVRKQVENVFGKLLYGSKFHRLKMSRGQQGIGIAAAGMYGLMTTGKPMVIHTKPNRRKPSHRLTLAIDLKKNKADVSDEEERHDFPTPTGTEVVIVLEGRFQRGRQSVDEYLQQTAIANPHARIVYQPPDAGQQKEEDENGKMRIRRKPASELFDDLQHALQLVTTASETTTTPGGIVVFPRTIEHLPEEPKEIKPHPRGVELGMLLRMLKDTDHRQLGGFLQNEFCRVSL